MYVNAFWFGVMFTLFVEMALVIVANVLPSDERKNRNKKINKDNGEENNNGNF